MKYNSSVSVGNFKGVPIINYNTMVGGNTSQCRECSLKERKV